MSGNRAEKVSGIHDLVIEKPAIIGAILGIAAFACFLPAAWYGFINIDDLPLISGNKLVNDASLFDLGQIFSRELYTPYYKPLTYISWIFERTVTGSVNPHVIHFNNAVIHGVNVFLVFMLSLRIVDRMWPGTMGPILTAMMCALLWGFHPLKLESVVWAVERKDVLFGLFYLLACISYFRYVTKGRKVIWLGVTVLLYLFSILSKSMGVTFFAAAVLIEFLCIGKETFSIPKIWSKLPLLIVLMLALHLQGLLFSPEHTGSKSRVVNAAKSNAYVPGPLGETPAAVQFVTIANMRLVGFAAHYILPFRTAIVYPREQWIEKLGNGIYILLAVPLFFLALFVLKKETRHNLGFGLFWFAATISPILITDATGTNFLSDRYTYIPSLGLVWIMAPGLVRLFPAIVRGTFTVGHAICSIAFIGLTALTLSNIGHWRTSTQLWQNMIDRYPVNWYGYYNRAKLIKDLEPQAALEDLNKALEYVDNQALLYFTRGTILMEQGNRQAAIADFTNALRYDSGDVQSLINRGSCYRGLKQYEAALADFNTAVSLGKLRLKALNNRGLAYLDMNKVDLALQDFNEVLAQDPDYTNAIQNRANIYIRGDQAQYQKAIDDYDRLIEALPGNAETIFRRGYSKAKLNRHQEALQDFDEAIRLDPAQGFYFYGRAQSYEALGMRAEALNDIRLAEQRGVRIDPALIARLQ